MNETRFSPFLGAVVALTVVGGAFSVWFEKGVAKLSTEWREAADFAAKPINRGSHVEPAPEGEVWEQTRVALRELSQANLDDCRSSNLPSFGSFAVDGGTLTSECRGALANASTAALTAFAASRASTVEATPVLLNETLVGQIRGMAGLASAMLRMAVEAGDVGRGSDICLDMLALARDLAASAGLDGHFHALAMTQSVFRGCWALIDGANTTYKTRFIDRLDTIDSTAPLLSHSIRQETARREFFAFPTSIRKTDLARVSPLWAGLVPTAVSLHAQHGGSSMFSVSDWKATHTALTAFRSAVEGAPETAGDAARTADAALKPLSQRLLLEPGYFERAVEAAVDRSTLLRMLRRAARADLMHLQTGHWPPEAASAGTDVLLQVGANDLAAITTTNPRLSEKVILLTPDVEAAPTPPPEPKKKKAGKK